VNTGSGHVRNLPENALAALGFVLDRLNLRRYRG